MAKKAPAISTATSTDSPIDNSATNFSRALHGIENGNQDEVSTSISTEIKDILHKFELSENLFLILYDEVDSISSFHSDRLYSAATKAGINKDILLLLHSGGGGIEPAYLVSKTLKRVAKKFSTVVPRRAKSAATLIALGSDEVHMGLMSELGPIDPQMGGLPALALGNALNVIAELVCKFPDAAPLLGKYISDQVPVRVLGYYERVNESAVQYAERLLNGKELGNIGNATETANHLVNHFKDHSFVIDIEESKNILGPMVCERTKEYDAANEIFEFLDLIRFICSKNGYDFWMVGTADNFEWRRKKSKE